MVTSFLALLIVLCSGLFTGFLKLDVEPIDKVILEVDYYSSWEGTIYKDGSNWTWSGFGKKTETLLRPEHGKWIISVTAQKMDDSSNPLKISITLLNGTIIKESYTNAPYGLAKLTAEIK